VLSTRDVSYMSSARSITPLLIVEALNVVAQRE
jgi:hypothetical protein